MNKSGHFNLLFDLALVLVSHLRYPQGICSKDIFAFNIPEDDFISNDSTNHSLYSESSKVIFNRFLQYGNIRDFVVIVDCHFLTISVNV